MEILINLLDEFNKIFEQEIEKAMKNNFFIYKIIHILLAKKIFLPQFNNSKNNCQNRLDKLLFHGTKASSTIWIESSQFWNATCVYQIGKFYAYEKEVERGKYGNIN